MSSGLTLLCSLAWQSSAFSYCPSRSWTSRGVPLCLTCAPFPLSEAPILFPRPCFACAPIHFSSRSEPLLSSIHSFICFHFIHYPASSIHYPPVFLGYYILYMLVRWIRVHEYEAPIYRVELTLHSFLSVFLPL